MKKKKKRRYNKGFLRYKNAPFIYWWNTNAGTKRRVKGPFFRLEKKRKTLRDFWLSFSYTSSTFASSSLNSRYIDRPFSFYTPPHFFFKLYYFTAFISSARNEKDNTTMRNAFSFFLFFLRGSGDLYHDVHPDSNSRRVQKKSSLASRTERVLVKLMRLLS